MPILVSSPSGCTSNDKAFRFDLCTFLSSGKLSSHGQQKNFTHCLHDNNSSEISEPDAEIPDQQLGCNETTMDNNASIQEEACVESSDYHDEVNEPGPSSRFLSELCNEDVDDDMVSVRDRVASSELGKENEPGQSILSSSETETASMERPLIDKTLKFPTDPALFANRAITPSLIEEILMLGPCQPGLKENIDYPRNDRRAFRREWYTPHFRNGMKSYREWLVYSPTNNRAYCFPCWLFAKRGAKEYSPAFTENGFDSWKKANTTFVAHEHSKMHSNAVTVMMQTKQRLKIGKTVNSEQLRV